MTFLYILLSPIDIQTRPTFVREELTEADLDKMVMVLNEYFSENTSTLSCVELI